MQYIYLIFYKNIFYKKYRNIIRNIIKYLENQNVFFM